MAEDNHTIRNSVIATVVGGLILYFLLWLVGFLPTVWGWIKTLASWLWGLVTSDVSTPVWLLAILIISGVPFFWRIGAGILALVLPDKSETIAPLPVDPATNRTSNDQLSENEHLVLKALASVDGGPTYLEIVAKKIRQNQLRTEQALDLLIRKGLVKYSLNYLHGTSYVLSDHGRDLAIELGYA